MNDEDFSKDHDLLIPMEWKAVSFAIYKEAYRHFLNNFDYFNIILIQNYSDDELQNPDKAFSKSFFHLISSNECEQILKERFVFKPLDFGEDIPHASVNIIEKSIEDISKRLFFNTCEKIVKLDILQMVWDPELNDFGYQFTQKYQDKITKSKKGLEFLVFINDDSTLKLDSVKKVK